MGKEGGQWWQAGALDTFGPEHRRLSPEEDKRVYVGGGGGGRHPSSGLDEGVQRRGSAPLGSPAPDPDARAPPRPSREGQAKSSE